MIDATHDADAHVPAEFRAVKWTRLTLRRAQRETAAADGIEGKTLVALGGCVRRLLAAEGPAARDVWREGAIDGRVGELEARGNRSGRMSRQRNRFSTWAAVGVIALSALAAAILWRLSQPGAALVSRAPMSAVEKGMGRDHTKDLSPAVAPLVARERTLVRTIDVTRSQRDTAAGLLELATKLEPTTARLWAERSLVECRYAGEFLDRSLRESTRRRDSPRRRSASIRRIRWPGSPKRRR